MLDFCNIDDCNGLLPIFKIIKKGVLPFLQLVVPIILLIIGIIDVIKAYIQKEKKITDKAWNSLLKKFIIACLLFFVVTFVNVVLNPVSGDCEGVYSCCWRAAE